MDLATSSSSTITTHETDIEQVDEIYKRSERWNFLKLFESVQGKDLRKGNPWLDREAAKQKRQEIAKQRKMKRVRFSLAEILPPHLPHCRRINLAKPKFGYLHSEKCKNSLSEIPDGPDDMRWRDRAFVLSDYVTESSVYSDFYIEETNTGCDSHPAKY